MGLAGHVWADDRVHAVSADDYVGGRTRAAGEMQLDAGAPLLDADASAAEVQALASKPVGECLQERNAVHAVVRARRRRFVRPVMSDRVVGDDLAGVPAPDHQRRRDDRDSLDLLADPEPAQLPRPVARQRYRGADLAQLVRLLVDLEPIPRSRSASASTSPPIPPPTMATLIPDIRYAIAGARAGASAKS